MEGCCAKSLIGSVEIAKNKTSARKRIEPVVTEVRGAVPVMMGDTAARKWSVLIPLERWDRDFPFPLAYEIDPFRVVPGPADSIERRAGRVGNEYRVHQVRARRRALDAPELLGSLVAINKVVQEVHERGREPD